ncbi:transposable element Tc3 transposase [Trichonephila clavipes]|nr:transposable element Tc3 transposase [Trichonephila clavipes]
MFIKDTFQQLRKGPRSRIRANYEQPTEFERGRIIGMKEAGWANRSIASYPGRNNAAIRICWQKWVESDRFQRHGCSGRPRALADRGDRLIVRSAVTAPDSLDKFFFQRCPDDHRRRVWRRTGQCANPAFPIARHTGPHPGVMVWGAVPFLSRTALLVIRCTLTAQWYVDDFLRIVLLPFLLQYPGLIFQQDNARPHTERVATYCLTHSLSNTSLAIQIARYFSNRACLGYEGKETASIGEY